MDVPGEQKLDNLSVHVSVEMPFDIRTIESPSHAIKMKVGSPSHTAKQSAVKTFKSHTVELLCGVHTSTRSL